MKLSAEEQKYYVEYTAAGTPAANVLSMFEEATLPSSLSSFKERILAKCTTNVYVKATGRSPAKMEATKCAADEMVHGPGSYVALTAAGLPRPAMALKTKIVLGNPPKLPEA